MYIGSKCTLQYVLTRRRSAHYYSQNRTQFHEAVNNQHTFAYTEKLDYQPKLTFNVYCLWLVHSSILLSVCIC